MSRLIKATREAMATALVQHKLRERGSALASESEALFAAVYEHQYPAPIRKVMAALLKLSPSGLKMEGNIYVNLRGQRFYVGSDRIGKHGVTFSAKPASRPTLCDIAGGVTFLEGDLADRLERFSQERAALVAEIATSWRKAVATLEQFTTGKKLMEEWPEAIPVIGKFISADDRAVPAVQLGTMNDEFGLPPSERLAA